MFLFQIDVQIWYWQVTLKNWHNFCDPESIYLCDVPIILGVESISDHVHNHVYTEPNFDHSHNKIRVFFVLLLCDSIFQIHVLLCDTFFQIHVLYLCDAIFQIHVVTFGRINFPEVWLSLLVTVALCVYQWERPSVR